MSNPTIFDGKKSRPMTDAEYAQWQLDAADAATAEQAATDAAATRASGLAKLKALGLTDAEVVALVGG